MVRISLSNIIFVLIYTIYAEIGLHGKESPLGVITNVKGDRVIVEFDSSVYLQSGTMVAIYGGGTVKKHPLTDEIVIKELGQVAKAQIKGDGGNLLILGITWKRPGFEAKEGMDVIPLPFEAAPNSPPVKVGEIDKTSVSTQGSAPLILPIQDPDGDDVFYAWKLKGENGRTGYLESKITRIPENLWYAPGIEGNVEISVTATDSYGHELELSVPLSTSAWEEDWRRRKLTSFCTFGDAPGAHSTLITRDQRGHWWTVANGLVFNISPGWLQFQRFLTTTGPKISSPVAIAPADGEVHFLERESAVISVFGYDGKLKRTYGVHSEPTDLVVSQNGIVFIADQSLGGVQVYEPNGMFRACLGRSGEGKDYFSQLKRLTLDREDRLYALDGGTGVIHRFGRFQQRLPSWELNLDGKGVAVNLSWHPKGELLILLSDGRILRLDQQGKMIKPFIKSVTELDYIDRLEPPESIYVDLSGETFVTYPQDGMIVRYTADGNLSGLRGPPFWDLAMLTTDCKGQVYGYHANSRTLFKFDSEGWVVKKIGVSGKNKVNLKSPLKLAVNPEGSALAVVDSDNSNIVRIDLTGKRAPIVFGQSGKSDGQFITPVDVTMDEAGNTYVLDSKLNRISIFDQLGYFLFSFGRKGRSDEGLRRPTLLAITPNGQNAYIYDNYEIKKFAIDHQNRTGTHISNAGGRGRGSGQLLKPQGMACDRQGLLYIADNGRKDLQVIDYRGSNAIVIYAESFNQWGFQKVSELALNVDGRPFLIDSGRMVWAYMGKIKFDSNCSKV